LAFSLSFGLANWLSESLSQKVKSPIGHRWVQVLDAACLIHHQRMFVAKKIFG